MLNLKPFLIFALYFFPLYGVLIIPWPGAKGIYARYFQAMGSAILGSNGGSRILIFHPLNDANHIWPQNFDTAIDLANRNLTDANGTPKGFMLMVDAWQMGWTPTAFVLALVCATPVSWRRRAWGALWGLLWIHVFILLTVDIFIWNESTRILLVTLSPFWKTMANYVEKLALDPAGPSFFAAAFIWIMVTFQKKDFVDWNVNIIRQTHCKLSNIS